jgi:hypothetical protein
MRGIVLRFGDAVNEGDCLWLTVMAGLLPGHDVIASVAKQSRGRREELDCFVASAPRNDG